jgi:hypothetical protein
MISHRHKSNRYFTMVRRSPWRRLPFSSSSRGRIILISVCCLLFTAPYLFRSKSHGKSQLVGSTAAFASMQMQNRCWLKRAFESGDFHLFSHRSYADSTQPEQPSCEDSLLELKSIGVNHLDLDLVLDESSGTSPRLIVGHPMEYKRTSDYYSPCANTEFDDMIQTLKKVYGQDFFISLEPKASWGKTQKELDDPALTNLPSSILGKLLEAVQRNELKGNCAAIVEINPAQDSEELDKEKKLLDGILEHCQFFKGVGISHEPPQSMGEYDIIMPTIEFHPLHSHNTGKFIPLDLWKKSVFWVVDNEENLQFATDFRPNGIVSNSPKNIVSIINGPSWCVKSNGNLNAPHLQI